MKLIDSVVQHNGFTKAVRYYRRKRSLCLVYARHIDVTRMYWYVQKRGSGSASVVLHPRV
jgi:hypothetical protein